MITTQQIEAALDAFYGRDRWINNIQRPAMIADMTRALEAADRAAWHSIETAPKDGTPIQVATQSDALIRQIMTTRWVARYAERFGEDYGWDFDGNGAIKPTRWRPLPAPPEAAQ